ncbi:MAG: exo-alpha-sialidase, partial [Exilibacterium sp.]
MELRALSWLKVWPLFGITLLTLVWQSATAQTANEPYRWDNVAIGGGGLVSGLVPSKSEPDLLYARTDVGGAYRWDASTGRWLPLMDWVSETDLGYLGVESLAIDESSPNNLYILAGTSYFSNGRTAILRSDDYGKTFTVNEVTSQFRAHGNGLGRSTGEKLQVDPNSHNIVYTGTRWNGLWKSNDFGASWSKLTGFPVDTTNNENGVSFVELDTRGSSTRTMYVGVSQYDTNLYVSHDAGESFSAISGGPTNLMPMRAKLSNDGILYIAYGDGSGPHGHSSLPESLQNGAVYKYNTANGQWTNITPAGYNGAFGGVSVDPDNSQRIIVSTINNWRTQAPGSYGDRFLLSVNGGATWTDLIADKGFALDDDGNGWINNHAIHWAGSIEFDPFNTDQVWVISGNGLFRNTDVNAAPSTWTFSVRGLEETVPLDLVSIPNGPVVSVIGDYDGFIHYDVTEYAPIHKPSMGTTSGLAVAAKNTKVMVRVGSSMYYTKDMGNSWTKTGALNGSKGYVSLSADGAVILHTPNGSDTTYRSTNDGSSWSPVNGLNITNARTVADPVNANVFYAYNSAGSFWKSTDKGISFSHVSIVPAWGSNRLALAPGSEGDIWLALYDGGLQRSTNGGSQWAEVAGPSYVKAVGLGKAAPGATYPAVYIWGDINDVRGLYRSNDEGRTWTR